MSIWVMKENAKPEELLMIRLATQEDLQQANCILIRDATLADIPAMIVAEHKSWPKESQRATTEILVSRMKIFPEGVKIAVKGNEVLGIASALLEDYSWENQPKSYFERTDNGLIRNHDPMGDTLSGTNIGVIPDAPPNVATALMQAYMALAIKKGLSFALSSPRLPGYHKVKNKMTAKEYAFATDEKGRPLDPVIRLHTNMGLELVDVLENYYPDEESCNCAAIVKWKNPLLPYYLTKVFNHFSRKNETHMIFAFPGGCYWAKSAQGGCTMCGFQRGLDQFWGIAKMMGINLTDFVSIFERALLHLKDTSCLDLFTGGSFWEIPDHIMASLFKRLNQIGQIKEVMIESRPEFVTGENVQKLKAMARPGLTLKVAIGLETVSDQIREKNINKGFSLRDYQKAVKLLENEGVIPCTYVLLKPLGLSEKEAIAETIKTVEWASNNGSKLTLLQVAFIQEGTELAKIYKKGEYRPPWLWSVLDILSRLSQKYPVSLGHFDDYPPPIAITHNCGQCDKEINLILEKYRQTNLLPVQFPECDCYQTWQNEVK
ncbi:MAG: hypothetical protein WC460_05400 [Patescibacteria group bacterium]